MIYFLCPGVDGILERQPQHILSKSILAEKAIQRGDINVPMYSIDTLPIYSSPLFFIAPRPRSYSPSRIQVG
jgi:hypothetical protein